MTNGALEQLLSLAEYEAFCRVELDDPYELLDELRAIAPVHWSPVLGSWVVTSYDEVNHALRGDWLLHDRVEINLRGIPGPVRDGYGGLVTHISNWLGFTDGPKHSRMREVSRQLVNPGLAAKMQPRITHLVRDLVGEMRALETVDLLDDLALRLPVAVVCDALGMEGADATQFHALTEDLGRFAGRVETSWGPEDQALLFRSNQSWLALEELFQRLIADKRCHPDDDVLSALVRAHDTELLSDDEVVGLSVFFFAAGHGTTRDLLANCLYLLMAHPGEVGKLQAATSRVGPAIEEALRYESPIPMVSQLAGADHVLAGAEVRAGDAVILHIGAANRDPAQFVDPGRFDVTRKENRHLAFGLGAHFCLGAPLARRQVAVVLEELAPDLDRLVFDEPAPKWGRGNMSSRTLTTLTARWSPRAGAPGASGGPPKDGPFTE
ncbi:MAG: cytochrome P450 [Acidimicrobiales bacterium]|jgi:cytochrome P450